MLYNKKIKGLEGTLPQLCHQGRGEQPSFNYNPAARENIRVKLW
jgi:hypothetical protein